MQIGRKDVMWNFFATSLRIASGVIVLPLVLRKLPSADVTLWNIFLNIGSLAALLDFGFSNSFSRNITYIFGGVQKLKSEGYIAVGPINNPDNINYGLLKSTLAAMQRFYGIMSILFLFLFIIMSPFYLHSILRSYSGNVLEVWVAWFSFGFLVAYQLYTYYYNALLTGRGMVRKSMQIVIISQSSRIILTVILLLLGFGLLSLVYGLLISDVLNRMLSYHAFYDKLLKMKLKESALISVKEIMQLMYRNAAKIGLTVLGGFFITKITMFIAPMYISLPEIAPYALSKQMIDLIAALGGLWFSTFYPQITQYRVKEDIDGVKRLYLKSKIWLIFIFISGSFGLLLLGDSILNLIHSQTLLLSTLPLSVFLFFSFWDVNNSFAMSTLLTKNEVPFYKSFLMAGLLNVSLLMIFLNTSNWGIWAIIIAPGIAQSVYQNWKWPLIVNKELNVKLKDYSSVIKSLKYKEA